MDDGFKKNLNPTVKDRSLAATKLQAQQSLESEKRNALWNTSFADSVRLLCQH